MRKTVTVLGILLMLSSSTVNAQTVSGIKSINNEYAEIDYKTDVESLSKRFNVRSSLKEIFRGNSERNRSLHPSVEERSVTPITQKELNWLIEHNLYSRERDIQVDNGNVIFGDISDLHFGEIEGDRISKSDFLMGLHKSTYGVIESRPLAFKIPSWRNAGEKYIYQECNEVDGELLCEDKVAYRDPPSFQNVMGGKSFKFTPQNSDTAIIGEFTEGDYMLYVTPNVKELYLESLMDKGIIENEGFLDMAFSLAYEKGNASSWKTSLPPFPMGYSERNAESKDPVRGNPLGSSYKIDGVDSSSLQGPSVFNIRPVSTDFFMEEDITGIEALKFVEAVLRMTEKDMTKTEAEIVSYKYGANYLSRFTEEDRPTLMFLTAKGILNFEEEGEYQNLYQELDIGYALKLMYRLANKDARMNFSEIQLTDSDNFWIGKGYSQYKLNVNVAGDSTEEIEVPLIQTKEVYRNSVTSMRSTSNYIASSWADGPITYTVVKIFEDPSRYRFRGKIVSELTAEDPYISEIVSDTKGNYEVSFTIPSSSGMSALKAVDSQITFTHRTSYESTSIMTVTKVNHKGKDLTLVPSSTLEALSFKGTRIEILEDKVLRNSSTGATAVLLPDNDLALVGTHVVSSEDLMVTPIGGEIYYNLEVIRTLLPNIYISDLDKSSIYITSGLVGERLAPVRSSDTNAYLGETYITKLDATEDNRDDHTLPSTFTDSYYVSLSHMGLGSNTIIKDFTIKDQHEQDVNFKMVVHLNFKLPDADGDFPNPIYNSSNPTHEEVHKFLYTAPLDKELYDTWWNNIELTNGLLNAIYGSTGENYVNSGWIYPSIHILYDKTDSQQIKLLKDFFVKAGDSISDDWFRYFTGQPKSVANRVVSGDAEAVFDPTNGEGMYYPKKRLVTEMFPLWVHAMFNNPYTEPELNPYYEDYDPTGVYTPVQGVGRKNSTLWRTMMDSRTILYESSTYSRKGYKVYQIGKFAYAVTNGAQVLMGVDDSNDFMQIGKITVKGNATYSNADGVFLRTRTETNSLDSWVGRLVRFSDADSDLSPENKVEFFVRSVNGNKISIVDLSKANGSPIFEGGTVELKGSLTYSNNGTKSPPTDQVLRTRYEVLRGLFSDNRYKGYRESLDKWGGKTSFIGSIGNRSEEPYISEGIPYKEYTQTSKIFYTSEGMKSALELKNKRVNGYVGLILDRNLWTIAASGDLRPRKTYPFLNIGSIYNTSVTRNIIDSMIMNYNGTLPVNEITEGSKLVIDDLVFVRRGEYFVSQPIKTDVNSVKVLDNPTDRKTIESWVLQLLVGKNIRVANTTDVSLTKYVEVEGLGEVSSSLDVEGKVLGLKDDKVVLSSMKGNDLQSSPYTKDGKTVANGIVVKVKLNDILLARPFYTSNTYELLRTTSQFSEGVVRNLPFFDEDLSLGSAVYDILSGQQEVIRPLNEAPALRDHFLKGMEKTFRRDFDFWVRAVVCSIISFLIVLSFLIYFLTRSGGLTNLIYELSRGKNGNKDFDIVKVLSLGMYDMQNPMKFINLAVFNVSAFLVMYMVWFISW